MRYGSVPDGYDKSMTHLEYDEAQKLSLPSLIYILDDSHSIPARDVETGTGAEKLQSLKEHLKKRHVVSFFTTPEDLQARIMHDVPAHLERMGVEVTGELVKAEEASDFEVLKRFEILPKLFSGRQVTIEFEIVNVRSAFSENCEALHLEHGATVASSVVIDSGQTFYVYGEREIALQLLSIPKGSTIKARANTAFGVAKQFLFADDEPFAERRSETGLVITQILGTEPADT
jgi:hypothetical protein